MLKLIPGRWLAVCAGLGGLSYTAANLAIEYGFPDHWAGSPDTLLGWGYAAWSRLLWIPTALMLIGFIAIHQQLRPQTGKLGTTGFWLTTTGFLLDILGLVIEFWLFGLFLVPWTGAFQTGSPGSNLGYAINGIGSMLLMIGLVISALACLRATIPPRWRIVFGLLALSSLSSFYFYFTNRMAVHFVIHGFIWIAAGLIHLPQTARSGG